MPSRASSPAHTGGQPSQDGGDTTAAPRRRKPRGGALHEDRLALLERTLCPTGETVLGLYIYTAGVELLQGLSRSRVYRAIIPYLIGAPAIVCVRPGLSQTELARYLGVERATVGKQVAGCLRRGWIRREVSAHDRRRFSLYITPKGERMLREVAQIIPQHEREYTAMLTAEERETLKRLLRKLVME